AAHGERQPIRQEAQIHIIVELDRPNRTYLYVAVRNAGAWRSERGRQEGKMILLHDRTGRDIEVALVRKIESKLQTREEALRFGRRKAVRVLPIAAHLKRYVLQRANRERLGVEYLIESKRASNQPIELGRARATGTTE